jgi:hypothetical protein
MDFSALFQFEWLLIEVLVLGLAVFELVSLRRSQRRDRDAAANAGPDS